MTSSERTVGSDDGELLVSVVVLHRLARPRVGLQPIKAHSHDCEERFNLAEAETPAG